MTQESNVSLFAFLLSPRASMARLNGWQRIWLVLTGALFALHTLVGYLLLPDFFRTRFDPAQFERRISDNNKWQRENQQKCKVAADDVTSAERSNTEYNEKGTAKAQELMAITQAKIDDAKAKLFSIETSGGKYYPEWAKYDQAIEAYLGKLQEQRWKPRPFNADAMVKPVSLSTLSQCASIDQQRDKILAEMETARQEATSVRDEAGRAVLGTFISFICVSLGLYLFGWCVGWIRVGFTRAR